MSNRIDLKQDFTFAILSNKIWKRLENMNLSSKFRVTMIRLHERMIRLYEKLVSNLEAMSVFQKKINCNIEVKHGFPFSPAPFGIYIDKLESFVEKLQCVETCLASLVTILLLYENDTILLIRNPFGIPKWLHILNTFCIGSRMTTIIEKQK